jgi:molybdopterin biosynthesis enzyme
MAEPWTSPQRLARLTPLADLLSLIDTAVGSVAVVEMTPEKAIGLALARDVVIATPLPHRPIALADGVALRADETLDAGSYAPAVLSIAVPVAAGEAIPALADAVLPFEAAVLRSERIQALAPVPPGAGVLPRAADAGAEAVIRRAGARLRPVDAAICRVASISAVSVRAPRLLICGVRADPVIDAASDWLGGAIERAGGVATVICGGVADALGAPDCDAVIIVGGTGTGPDDASIETLRQRGGSAVHGVGLSPGESAGFGTVGDRPALFCPGRLDAAIAVFATLGRRLLARLAGRQCAGASAVAMLGRKVTSTIGMVEFVPVSRKGEAVEPLASGYLPFSALAGTDGYILVPAESEGFPAGTNIAIYSLP